MPKNSIKSRLRVTRTGKVVRRSMGLGHSRSNKSGTQAGRRRKNRTLTDFKAIAYKLK